MAGGTTGGPAALVVLLVEDNAAVRTLLAVVLAEDLGARVVEAATGPDALAAARREAPALVVLDRMLPGLGGLEVLRRLREEPATRTVPVVAMSAALAGAAALEAGCAAFLQKPFDLDDVVAAARRALLPPLAGGSPDPVGVLRPGALAGLRLRCRHAAAATRGRLHERRQRTEAALAAARTRLVPA